MNDVSAKVHVLLDEICPEARITVSNTYMMYTLAANSESRSFVFEAFPPGKKTLDAFGLVSIPFEDVFSSHLGYIKPAERELSALSQRYLELMYKELCIPCPESK